MRKLSFLGLVVVYFDGHWAKAENSRLDAGVSFLGASANLPSACLSSGCKDEQPRRADEEVKEGELEQTTTSRPTALDQFPK